jgi:NAD(P)-dependent dehydrogenase (short-subunit alcohol dehydrogenase family)
MRLEGQIAIVTGASRGIGQAIALTLAKEGAAVIVNGRNIESIKKVVDEVKSLGGQALPVKADVSSSKEVNKLVEITLDKYQKIDILVNNAGVNELVPTLELTENQWYNIVDVNLKSQFLCSQAVARQMIEQKRGKIVNIASIGAHVGTPGQAAYAASKAGIVQLTKVLAVEWGKYSINVNAVSPGMTMTAMMESLIKERPDFIEGIKRIPLRRPARPEDIANVVLFLVSSESDYITGQELIVDGGSLTIHPRMVKPTE